MTHKVKIHKYTVVLEPAEEGGYVVYVPYLPGCVTQGETFEESVEMARDAIEGYLVVLGDAGEKIPIEPQGVIISEVMVKSQMR